MIFVQRFATLAISPSLKVDGVKGVAVVSYFAAAAFACSEVPQADRPTARFAALTAAAELLQLVPEPPAPARVEISLMTTDVGMAGVRVLASMSFLTERETNPS